MSEITRLLEAAERGESHPAEELKLRFFGGLPNAQAAELLGIPERTATRLWAYARAWLHRELRENL